jgi:nicotinate phosphoribosyltransferase
MPIIKSLLDTDIYKYSMAQLYFHQMPTVTAKFAFKCRNTGIDFRPYTKAITDELDSLEVLSLNMNEVDYLSKLGYFKDDFLSYLESVFCLNSDILKIRQDGPDLIIETEGPIIMASMYETFVLSIVNEVYFRNKDNFLNAGGGELDSNIDLAKKEPGFKLIEFGTRRRRSRNWHEYVLRRLKRELGGNLVGTSNVDLARQLGLVPIGTMAHEFLECTQSLTVLPNAQKLAMEMWVKEYGGKLGIILTDVWGIDAFLADFDWVNATVYDGVRHDSGDPYAWGEKIIRHYSKLGIGARCKKAVFSDSLDFVAALELYKTFGDRMNCSFGIGTKLTNNIPGSEPLNVVMKMVSCNGHPVAKVSDAPGKTMCDDDAYLNYLKKVIRDKVKS